MCEALAASSLIKTSHRVVKFIITDLQKSLLISIVTLSVLMKAFYN